MSKHPAYNSWRGMKERCKNPKHIRYKWYGAKGVQVCDDWESFDNFWRDMGPTWKKGLTLERKNASNNFCLRSYVQLEIIEEILPRPFAVGDRVRYKSLTARIIHIDDGSAWIRWERDGSNPNYALDVTR